VKKYDYSTGDTGEDSLFIVDMITGKRTFVQACPWGAPSGLAVSRDGSTIAYFVGSTRQISKSNLYVANSDGTDRRIVIENALIYDGLAFSPDGRKIAYLEYTTESATLHVADVSTGANSVIADSVFQEGLGPFSWSPDGTRIACTRGLLPDDTLGVWVANVNGSGMQRLTPSSAQDLDPQWSPDGSQIVCSSGPPGDHRNIVLMNSDGTGRRQLTRTTEMINDLARWSPDGTKIIYHSFTGSPTGNSDSFHFLYVLEVQSGVVKELAAAAGIGLAYWDQTKR
jgi:Tol biopolymer transport system component